MCGKTVENLSKLMRQNVNTAIPIPIFGICMGNLLLGMAAGFRVQKLKFGNRGHNQPAIHCDTGKCYITSQNHGYALDINSVNGGGFGGWLEYFKNANDGSNEGIRHSILPWSSVQFHPEAKGGPLDTEYLFDGFLKQVEEFREKSLQVRRGENGLAWMNGKEGIITKSW